MSAIEELNGRIVRCERCPRLREWCRQVAEQKRRAFSDEAYWGLPVPNFGDREATGLIVGLAPAAHGANRTGRMFTGDRSGDWLYRALHKAGLANQPTSASADDGLRLRGVMITAVNHCAPPGNKPTREEVANCRSHLLDTLALREWRAFLCLGSIAWMELWRASAALGGSGSRGYKPPLTSGPQARVPKFAHGAEHATVSGEVVLASYHPSQQNTFTGVLTEEMFDEVVGRFAKVVRGNG